MRTLVLGGARSGKSRYAEQQALHFANTHTLHYLATATVRDAEMHARVTQHRQRRCTQWHTHEVPLALPAALTLLAQPQQVVLVDCLTLWLSNGLLQETPQRLQANPFVPSSTLMDQGDALITVLQQLSSRSEVFIVSNELGQGVVPLGSTNRWFVDYMGDLNQRVAAVCDKVVWMVAGLPQVLKG